MHELPVLLEPSMHVVDRPTGPKLAAVLEALDASTHVIRQVGNNYSNGIRSIALPLSHHDGDVATWAATVLLPRGIPPPLPPPLPSPLSPLFLPSLPQVVYMHACAANEASHRGLVVLAWMCYRQPINPTCRPCGCLASSCARTVFPHCTAVSDGEV